MGFLLLFACQRVALNEIPEECYPLSYAILHINEEFQVIPEDINPLTGINDNYLFGADPFGGWSFDLTNDSFGVYFNAQERFISLSEYENSSHQEWRQLMRSRGKYSIKDPKVTRTNLYLFDEEGKTTALGNNNEDILDGEVEIDTFQDDNCYFIKVKFWAYVKGINEEVFLVEGELTSPYGPINL